MAEFRLIHPVKSPIQAEVSVPGSKSITNRALLLAALANGESSIEGALFSDDTRVMINALRSLHLQIKEEEKLNRIAVCGMGGEIPAESADLFVGNAGTAARFLLAAVAAGHGRYRLDGAPRMRERPFDDLIKALKALGARISFEGMAGFMPLTIEASGLRGGSLGLRGDVSSQFLSALLMVSPLAESPVEIRIIGPLISEPYVVMTMRMMGEWGAEIDRTAPDHFIVSSGQHYQGRVYPVEPDASSASYFFAAAALTGGLVTVKGFPIQPLQGDLEFVEVLRKMGCLVSRNEGEITVIGAEKLQGVDVDMNRISDTAITLAAMAPFASGPTTIRNVGHMRYQETDRLAAITTELRRLGVEVQERTDSLTISPAQSLNPSTIHTYNDHRMAMSFALIGLKAEGVQIADSDCVTKTFPDYFERLDQVSRPAGGGCEMMIG